MCGAHTRAMLLAPLPVCWRMRPCHAGGEDGGQGGQAKGTADVASRYPAGGVAHCREQKQWTKPAPSSPLSRLVAHIIA